MTIDDEIKEEKLQYDIKQQKYQHLSSSIIDKYEFFTGKEAWPCDQSRIWGQAKFTYSLLGKVFEKQMRTIEDQRTKQE